MPFTVKTFRRKHNCLYFQITLGIVRFVFIFLGLIQNILRILVRKIVIFWSHFNITSILFNNLFCRWIGRENYVAVFIRFNFLCFFLWVTCSRKNTRIVVPTFPLRLRTLPQSQQLYPIHAPLKLRLYLGFRKEQCVKNKTNPNWR